jgi:hypothetical protein
MELIPWLLGIYAVICVAAYFGNRLFMYFPDPTRTSPAEAGLRGVEEVEIAGSTSCCSQRWEASKNSDRTDEANGEETR